MSGALAAPFVAIVLTQVAVLATSIYLHRPLANRSLHLHPIADIAFRTILWLTTGQCRQEWVAVHRKQHTFIDREGDPHSPRLLGFWRVQVFNVNYVREARNPENPRHVRPRPPPRSHGPGALLARRARTSRGTRVLVRSDRLGPGLGAGLMHAVLYVFVMAPLINALGHWRGSRNFENTASNWRLLAWITGGESLHNNHHAHPRSAKFSVRRSEFDHTVNVFAFSTPRAPDWRWRIVDAGGAILEESSTTFESIADAIVAGRERLQLHLDRERPAPARVPWHRRH